MKNLTFIVLILLGSLNAMAQVVDTSKINQPKQDVSNISAFEIWQSNHFKDIESDIKAINLRLDKTQKRRKTGIGMMAIGLGSAIIGTILISADTQANNEAVSTVLIIGGSTMFTIGLFVK